MPKKANSGLFSNKFYVALSQLSTAQRKKFLRFLKSPYFAQNANLLKICSILGKLADEQMPGFDRDRVWESVFPGVEYDDVSFRKSCSDLLKQLYLFMAHETLEQDKMRITIDSFDYIVKNKVESLYNSVARDLDRLRNETIPMSSNRFLNNYHFERKYYEMMDYDVKVEYRSNLEEMSKNLDIYYWIEKLKIATSAVSQQKTQVQVYAIDFIEEIKTFLSSYKLDAVPELAMYFYSFLMIRHPDESDYYFKLKSLLDQYGGQLEIDEAQELMNSALHYCTGRINKGFNQFYQEYFDLFVSALDKNLLIQRGELALWRFNNIIGAALRLGKLDWAESFIETYHTYLPAESRQNTYTFNLARVYRFQEKYQQVISLLRNVEYEDIGYNLISKMMLMITYYETNEIAALESFTSAFRTFLKRHRNIPEERSGSYLNLIKYTKKLMRINPRDKVAAAKLRAEVLANKAFIVNHEWLLGKLPE